MTRQEWAENECKLLLKREQQPDGKKDVLDGYVASCIESALKAYKSLCEDGHSGMSFSVTRDILIKLMNDEPLTPITEKDFDGVEPSDHGKYLCYQCPRKTSLFKDVYPDGKVEYKDVDRVIFIDKYGSWTNGFVSRLVEEKYPLKFPYYGNEKFYAYGETYTITEKGEKIDEQGQFNTLFINYIKLPDGTIETWNKEYRDL